MHIFICSKMNDRTHDGISMILRLGKALNFDEALGVWKEIRGLVEKKKMAVERIRPIIDLEGKM